MAGEANFHPDSRMDLVTLTLQKRPYHPLAPEIEVMEASAIYRVTTPGGQTYELQRTWADLTEPQRVDATAILRDAMDYFRTLEGL